MATDFSKHPCFNVKAKGTCARIHLPVAPKCNIMCNFCNRKYDCVNESRPGVTSAVLSPAQAEAYLGAALEKEPRITVVGIAGPGDPFANADRTLETMRRIKTRWPDMLLCLSSNGLELPAHIPALADIGVSHVTVTVNAVDAAIAARIYSWARLGKVLYRGPEAGALLVERQAESIRLLKEHGLTVKVNTIVIPGVNDQHIEDIARTMKARGVDLLNLMALYPNPDTVFADLPEPSKEIMGVYRDMAETYLPQMRHCQRCRADAVGLLESDRSGEFASCLSAHSKMTVAGEDRPYVAVATMEGMLVNQHLGEATSLSVFGPDGQGGFTLVEERETPPPGSGHKRWYELAAGLRDCRAVLVSGVGDTPRTVLEEEGLTVVEMDGMIEQGLAAIYGGASLDALKRKRGAGLGCASGGCKGGGGGCG